MLRAAWEGFINSAGQANCPSVTSSKLLAHLQLCFVLLSSILPQHVHRHLMSDLEYMLAKLPQSLCTGSLPAPF